MNCQEELLFIKCYQGDDFHTKKLEVSKDSIKTDFILGVPYSFYPYLHPITKISERPCHTIVMVTRTGIWRKNKKI